MPYDLVDQMHLPYTRAHARARLVRDHTFEMDLLTWERVHEAKDEDQVHERVKVGKQRMKATKNASKGNGEEERQDSHSYIKTIPTCMYIHQVIFILHQYLWSIVTVGSWNRIGATTN